MYCVFQHPTSNIQLPTPNGLKPKSELEAKSISGFLESVVNSLSFVSIRVVCRTADRFSSSFLVAGSLLQVIRGQE